MHKWYVVGLFERKKSPPDWPEGFVATWSVVEGPFVEYQWAKQRAQALGPETEIRIGEAKWRCVFAVPVRAVDLREYGFSRYSNGAKQLTFAHIMEEK